MILTKNVVHVIKRKFNVDLIDEENIDFILIYNGNLPMGTTEYIKHKKDGDTSFVTLRTSFGVFHQKNLSYNDLMVVLMEKVTGALSVHRDDLIIAALTYPNVSERRVISCGIKK